MEKASYSPRDLRTHILRLLGPKTILYKAFGLFRSLGFEFSQGVLSTLLPLVVTTDLPKPVSLQLNFGLGFRI